MSYTKLTFNEMRERLDVYEKHVEQGLPNTRNSRDQIILEEIHKPISKFIDWLEEDAE